MASLREANLPLGKLLVDPNNYRFQDDPSFVFADEHRFHEAGVQERALKRLRDDSLRLLKDSIRTNGFLPFERLIVRPYAKNEDELYLVLEGNRRLAALRWLKEDHEAGVEIPERVLVTLTAVPVVIVEGEEDPGFYEALMGVRHVSGIKQWAGYQRARLVSQLRDTHNLEASEVALRLGMSTQEVNRRYRAFKALEQMQGSEDFGGFARPDMYPIFHEAVSLPVVREWLGWDEGQTAFTNPEPLEDFYRLITPLEDEDGQRREPKIRTYGDVRQLRDIVPNPEAKRILLDPEKTLFDAVAIAKREQLSKSWLTQVAEAIGALDSLGIAQIKSFGESDLIEIKRLAEVADELLSSHTKLTT